MNDTDYIRKAVELVDIERHPWDYYKMKDIDPPHEQFMVDALAAQLVRQVDATGDMWLEIASNGAVRAWNDCSEICLSFADDRTMNTIKAIVDSGVLDTDREGQ